MRTFTCDTPDCTTVGSIPSQQVLPKDWRTIRIILGAAAAYNQVTVNKDICPQCVEKLATQMQGLRQDPEAEQTPEDLLYDVVMTMVDEAVDERMSQ